MVSAPEAVVDLEAVEARSRAVAEGCPTALTTFEASPDLRAELLAGMAAELKT